MMPALLIRMCNGRPDARNLFANASIEAGSINSSVSTSTRGMPASAVRAFSCVRAGTTTVAPASARARVVSRPTPEYPPVTTAVFPVRSRPARTSLPVVFAPNPEFNGFCSVVISVPSRCRFGATGVLSLLVLLIALAKRERKDLDTGIEEFNLKGHVFDWPFLTDELIHPGLPNFAGTIRIGIDSVIVTWSRPIQSYLETNRAAVLRRAQDHMEIA